MYPQQGKTYIPSAVPQCDHDYREYPEGFALVSFIDPAEYKSLKCDKCGMVAFSGKKDRINYFRLVCKKSPITDGER